MLKEYSHLQKNNESSSRRWFSDDDFDLMLYEDNDKSILKFELCYDKGHGEHAISWRKSGSYSHYSVDDGEGVSGQFKMTPILVADGVFEWERIANHFLNASEIIDKEIADFVYKKILEYPESRDA